MNKRKVFLLMLVVSIIVTLVSKVEAAQTLDVTDYLKASTSSENKAPDNADEYEEIEDEVKKEEGAKTENNNKKEDEDKVEENNKTEDSSKTENTNKTEATQENANTENNNSANTIDGEHATTGVFNNLIYTSAGIIALLIIVLAYNKLKKYNY